MPNHKLTLAGLFAASALIAVLSSCSAVEDAAEDQFALFALLTAANNNAVNSVPTTVAITNNSGATRSYTLHLAGSGCTNAAAAASGSINNNATGAAQVTVDATGYDISDGTNCAAVATATSFQIWTCVDSGGGGIICS